MNNISDWLGKNLAWIIGVTAATFIAWGNLNARVSAIGVDYEQLDSRLVQLQTITERIVALEEGRQTNAQNIQEIKTDIRTINQDIKDIKEHFEIK